jgi:hypothetical protein
MSKNTDKYSAAELQKKYAGTGYKSVTNKGMSASSFWLGDAFMEEKEAAKTLTGVDRKASDYVRLAAYQRAISNFVRIVTARGDIPVQFSTGNDSYTDGKSVVLSARLEDNEFDSAVGLALHEGSHIALTDFQYSKEVFYRGKYPQSIQDFMYELKPGCIFNQDIYKSLVNIIEDRRIDRFVYDSAPGYQDYYQALYKKYFNSKEIDMALAAGLKNDATSWDDYLFHICNFTNPNRNLATLPALKKIWSIIDIPNINRLKSTKEVFEVAAEVYLTIDEAVKSAIAAQAAPKPKPGPKPKPKPAPSKAEKFEEEEESEDLNENLDVPKTSMSDAGADSNDETGSDVEGSEDENETEESSGAGSESDNESEEEGEDGTAASDEESEEEAAQKAEEQKKLLDRIGKVLKRAIKKQQDFLEGKTDKKSLSKSDANKVNAATKSGATYESVGGMIEMDNGSRVDIGKANVIVVRGLSKEVIESGIVGPHAIRPEYVREHIERGYCKDYIAEGITLGTLLGKRLKTRDEERTLKTTRLGAGRIDKRLIAELGFGNDKVFAQTNFATVTPVYVHISLDASGSMSGKPWQSAMRTAVAIAKAASMTASMDVVISVRGSISDTPLMWVIYDSRKDNLNAVKESLLAVSAEGSTPEGLCFEAIQKEMIKDARGKEAYFINVSDGAPSFSCKGLNYLADNALIHTRNCCNTLRQAGINILSYFVSERVYTKYYPFDKMYGKDAAYINVESLTQLSKTLNSLFERKQ